jgi:GxxExxY protein
MTAEDYNELSKRIISFCIAVHLELRPGLLESVYESALSVELTNQNILHKRQVYLPVIYKGLDLNQI